MISPNPQTLDILLEEGMRFKDSRGNNREALGTGIVVCGGSSRSGKSCLSWWLLQVVIERTSRHIALVGMSDIVLKSLPSEWRDRISNPLLENITEFPQGSVILIDDASVLVNNRSSGNKSQVALNRIYGIISHLSMSIIFTTQSLATIDIAIYRSTHLSIIIRYFEPYALDFEQHIWTEKVRQAQVRLKHSSRLIYYRDMYYSIQDNMICKVHFPRWLDRTIPEFKESATILSKPYGFLSQEELTSRITTGKN